MKKSIVFIFIFVMVSTMSGIFAFFTTSSYKNSIEKIEGAYIYALKSRADVMAKLVRDKLLSGNVRGAVTRLNILSSESDRFAFSIEQQGQPIIFSNNYSDSDPNSYYSLKSPIYFNQSKEIVWGSVHIHFYRSELTNSVNAIMKEAKTNTLIFSAIFMLAMLVISSVLFYSLKLVEPILKKYISEDFQNSNLPKAAIKLWEPLTISLNEQYLKYVEIKKEADEKKRKAEYYEIARQVAHDIRSPLSAISALCSKKELPEGWREILSMSASRIGSVADDLLSKKEIQLTPKKNQEVVSTHPTNPTTPIKFEAIKKIIEGICEEQEVQGHSIEAQFFEPEEDNFCIWAHLSSLERILNNVIKNAIESQDSKALRITISAEVFGSFSELSIRDNGEGIPPDVLAQVGQEGFTTKGDKGNGLGIFAAKQYQLSIGGNLAITSTVGLGTTIRLSYPCKA